MEQTLSVKPRKMNGMGAIIIFAIAAILLIGVGYIANLIGMFVFNDFSTLYHLLMRYFGIELRILAIGEALASTFAVFVYMLPFALLLAYVLFCYLKAKLTVLLPISLGLFCLIQIGHYVSNLLDFVCDLLYNRFGFLPIESVSDLAYSISLLLNNIVFGTFYIIVAIACIIMIISSLKGFSNKAMVIAPATVGIVASGISIISLVVNRFLEIAYMYDYLRDYCMRYDSYYDPYTGYDEYIRYFDSERFYEMLNRQVVASALSVVATSTVCLAVVAFFVAVIILAAKNYIPEIIPIKDEKLAILAAKKPKAALAILKTRYECGKLSEEDYNTRVAEISPIE